LQNALNMEAKIKDGISWQNIQAICKVAVQEEISSQGLLNIRAIVDNTESIIDKTINYVASYFNEENKKNEKHFVCGHILLKTYALFTTCTIFLLFYPKTRMYILEKIRHIFKIDLLDTATEQ